MGMSHTDIYDAKRLGIGRRAVRITTTFDALKEK
jgi:hypothetical protein